MKPAQHLKLHWPLAAISLITAGALHAEVPSPDPATFDVVPTATSGTEITMTASVPATPAGVEYYFTETSGNAGGDDSGWQASPTYVDSGLSPSTVYTYTVKTRDQAVPLDETAESTAESAATDGALVYESFNYAAGAISGNNGGVGFSGPWSNTRNNPSFDTPGLTWGSLLTAEGKARGNAWSGLIRPLDSSLADAGLLDNGSTLWFSVMFDLTNANTSNADLNFALCNATKFESGTFGDRENLTPSTAEGIGVTHSGARIQGVYWQDSDGTDTISERTENNSSLFINGNGTNGNLRFALIVGKIDWGVDDSADETLTLYAPDTALVQGAPIMSAWTIPALDQTTFNQVALQFKDQPWQDEIRFGRSYNEVVTFDLVANPDATAPTPDPLTFETGPTGVTDSVITMTASEANDPSGVEYYFTCTSANAPDSGWQSSRSYTVSGLTPATTYTYTVKARDRSPAQTEGGESAPASGDTLGVDNNPPTPNPMTFATAPTALTDTEITMTADTATDDVYGVEYNFICTVGGGPDSGWQSSPTFVATGLTPDTLYEYTVTARDTSPNLNDGTASTPASTSTLPTDNTPPGPNTWDVVPTATSPTEVTMTASVATDDQYTVEYYFANLSVPDGSQDSGWQTSNTYTDTGLAPFTSYTYEVRLRDTSYAQNESSSTRLPAVTQTDPAVTTPSLVEGPFNWLSSQNAPTNNLNFSVSVFPGSAFFSGQGNYPGNVARTVFSYFGDGTVADYKFFAEDGTTGVILNYASGPGGIIADVTTTDTNVDDAPWANIWTASDPGADFSANPADFTSDTFMTQVAGTPAIEGDIDISGMTEGIVYILYGAYRNTPNIDVTMSGAGQTDVVLENIGNNDGANNNENYVCSFSFQNAENYDTISFDYNSNNGRFLGVIVDGFIAPPTTDYEDWAAQFAPADLTDPDADLDGDGLTNNEERLFGLDPTDPSSQNPYTVGLDAGAGTFSFTRRDDALTNLFTAIEVSTDLQNWTVDGGAILVEGAVDGNGVETVAVTLSAALLTNPELYVRVNQNDGVIFTEDFESGDGGFTATGTPNDWAYGTPDSNNEFNLVVTGGNNGSTGAWGTSLGDGSIPSGLIDTTANSLLRSPDIDLSGVSGATLEFAAAIDAQTGDAVQVIVRNAGDDTALATLDIVDTSGAPVTTDWASFGPLDISAGAGSTVYLEFRFAGSDANFIGLYIDDIVVTQTP